MHEDRPIGWRRSSRCVGESHCVEVNLGDHEVLLRNSTRPDVSLTLSLDQWRGLIAALKSPRPWAE
ncbi:DUF397 domain-containing protein [Paractinoplanes lichenicola]|uniref:DUF397 domain-containing protein n=1 Tax=Paractinoplanes lichenicola TaxID=2802976 RepID=A0ABS1VNA2_9ACTN|nr:DUF397 domain-containing protein [Actinoplanes lichenicola]